MSHTKATILCVDDNEDTRMLLTCLLSLSSYGVMVAESVAEALSLAERIPFDLFVLDVRLPDGSGIELCRKFSVTRPETPVLFYSAVVNQDEIDEALQAGGKAYLRKPVSVADLNHFVAELLGESRGAE